MFKTRQVVLKNYQPDGSFETSSKSLPMLKIKSPNNLIAYFSMEIGIDPEIPTYAGGLGVLAGDILRSFADLGVPAVGVTLLSETGYLTQQISQDHYQVESFQRWNVEKYLDRLEPEIVIRVDDVDVHLKLWRYTITGLHQEKIPIIFIDANHEQNPHEYRKLTQRLYPSNQTFRLLQEIILGIGGVRALKALGFEPTVYHLNEGHSAFLTLELYKSFKEQNYENPLQEVRNHCVFTTHTPVPAGHDKFPKELVRQYLEDFDLLETAPDIYEGNEHINMTKLAITMSGKINGVAPKHAEVSELLFPKHEFSAITNGIHHLFWTTPSFHLLFSQYVPGWENDPFSLLGSSNIPLPEIEKAHLENKQRLLKFISGNTDISLDENMMTIGYARRITRYKRPDLIFYDLPRLNAIADKFPLQLVFSGKSDPSDLVGKSLIHEILNVKNKLNPKIKFVFLENYNLNLAKMIIPGVDLWLNTPLRPLEASGTSGMKASLNGVPNFSVLDGWWLEGHLEGITGWSIGPNPITVDESQLVRVDYDDSEDLYSKLENIILPMYYNNRDQYTQIRRQCSALHGSFFNTHRVVQQYIIKSYLT